MTTAKKRASDAVGGRRRRGVRFELTSLMDVMFLVLVFFIYSIFDMTVHKGLRVDLPNASGRVDQGEKIIITILPDDSMQFNGMALSKDEIVERVRELRRLKMELPILISGDRKSSLGVGIELLSDLKAVGAGKVAFQVKGEKESP